MYTKRHSKGLWRDNPRLLRRGPSEATVATAASASRSNLIPGPERGVDTDSVVLSYTSFISSEVNPT
jgi:hypothetical protein